MMHRGFSPVRLVTLGALLMSGLLHAQDSRDPTLPPAAVDQAEGAAVAVHRSWVDGNPLSLIVRDGRSYLVVGTRLYAAGQKIGQIRIERISESEVCLRDGAVLRRVSLHSGVERQLLGSGVSVSANTPGSSAKTSATAAACSEK